MCLMCAEHQPAPVSTHTSPLSHFGVMFCEKNLIMLHCCHRLRTLNWPKGSLMAALEYLRKTDFLNPIITSHSQNINPPSHSIPLLLAPTSNNFAGACACVVTANHRGKHQALLSITRLYFVMNIFRREQFLHDWCSFPTATVNRSSLCVWPNPHWFTGQGGNWNSIGAKNLRFVWNA